MFEDALEDAPGALVWEIGDLGFRVLGIRV